MRRAAPPPRREPQRPHRNRQISPPVAEPRLRIARADADARPAAQQQPQRRRHQAERRQRRAGRPSRRAAARPNRSPARCPGDSTRGEHDQHADQRQAAGSCASSSASRAASGRAEAAGGGVEQVQHAVGDREIGAVQRAACPPLRASRTHGKVRRLARLTRTVSCSIARIASGPSRHARRRPARAPRRACRSNGR